MKLKDETNKTIQDACREVISELRSVQTEEQMSAETLGDNLGNNLGNMTAAANEYAKAMTGVTPDNFAEHADDMTQALSEQLRAVVKMARNA